MLYLSLSLELDSPRVKSPNNVYLFWLLTTFVLSFVLSSNNKNSFAGLHASRKCQLCTDHLSGKIQMTKFKIVKQHICLAMKMSPIFFWLYPTFTIAHYSIWNQNVTMSKFHKVNSYLGYSQFLRVPQKRFNVKSNP